MKLKIDNLATSVARLEKMAIHIKALRFPHYRNYEANQAIDFLFPITVVLGKNGTNKSSLRFNIQIISGVRP